MNPVSLRTNRDLYEFIMSLAKKYRDCSRTLEEYLRALLVLARRYREKDAISLSEFAATLESAFTVEPASFDGAWEQIASSDEEESFDDWERFICRQIVDLRQMERAGTLKDSMRYFGIASPRGSRWFNFDPITFLECATAGSFDGWEPGDESGRSFVPGKVATLNENGEVVAVDPQELLTPTTTLSSITWHQFCDFLFAGQTYE